MMTLHVRAVSRQTQSQAIQKNAWRFAAHGGCILNETLGPQGELVVTAVLVDVRYCVVIHGPLSL